MGKPARVKNVSTSTHGVYFGGPSPDGTVPAKVTANLHQAFEGLGLTPYQARVLVALLQAGPASCLDLARIAAEFFGIDSGVMGWDNISITRLRDD